MLSFTLGASSITVFLDGVFNSIDSEHANYPMLLAELQKPPADRDLAAIRTYITIKSLIEHLSIGRVTVFEDAIHFDGKPVHNYMAERMLEILNQGIDLTPWATFMDNLHDNPADYAIDELYQWLEKAKMPLTPDGCFLAFKKVRRNYKDCHSGIFDNSPGSIVEMDRDACDTNRLRTCSTGFHFCSIGYIGNFGGERVVVVKINPRDVTSIPADYNYTKGRCFRYEVVAELDDQSAAYHNCWRKGVVNLENPAELPAGILSKIKLPDPVADVSVMAESDPADDAEVSLTEIAAIHAEEDTTFTVPASRLDVVFTVEDTCALIEAETTDAGKPTVTPVTLVVGNAPDAYGNRITVETVAGGLTPEQKLDLANAAVVAADIEPTPEMIFTTADGREFTARAVQIALEDASIRGAARNLGIQDSTLRGWKKKLGL